MKKGKTNLGKQNASKAVVIGTTASLLAALGMSFILAIFTYNEYIDITSNTFGSKIIVVLAVLFGSTMGITLAKTKKILIAVAVCISYFLINICIALLLFDGLGEGLGTTLIACIISISVAVIGAKPSKSLVKKRRIKISNR